MNEAGEKMQTPCYAGSGPTQGTALGDHAASAHSNKSKSSELPKVYDEMLWKYFVKCYLKMIDEIKKKYHVTVGTMRVQKIDTDRRIRIFINGNVGSDIIEAQKAIESHLENVETSAAIIRLDLTKSQYGDSQVKSLLLQLSEKYHKAEFECSLDPPSLKVITEKEMMMQLQEELCRFLWLPHNEKMKQNTASATQNADNASYNRREFTFCSSKVKVFVYCLNIDKLETDAIVAFTNRELKYVGGLEKIFESTFGKTFLKENMLKKNAQKLVYGDVCVTKLDYTKRPTKLKHMVACIVSGASERDCINHIRSSLLRALAECHTHQMKHVAIPASKHGIMGLPNEEIATIVCSMVREFVGQYRDHGTLREIHLVDIVTTDDSSSTFCEAMVDELMKQSQKPDSNIVLKSMASSCIMRANAGEQIPPLRREHLKHKPHTENKSRNDENEYRFDDVDNHQNRRLPYPLLNVRDIEKNKDVYSKFAFQSTDLKVYVYNHDITQLQIDAIVNAANGQLSHGAGVAKAIADAAGEELEKECQHKIRDHGPLPTGQATVTTGGNLPARSVIHTVGPMCQQGSANENDCMELTEAVINCLRKCKKEGFRHVAIPAISSGIFGMPIDMVSSAICLGIIEFSQHQTGIGYLEEIHLVNIETDISTQMTKVLKDMSISHCSDLKAFEIKGMDLHHLKSTSTSRSETKNTIDSEIKSTIDSQLEECPICLEQVTEKASLPQCNHVFCKSCLQKAFQYDKACPLCKKRYGAQTGNQPKNGSMTNKIIECSLPGFKDTKKTIVIDYHFADGRQGKNHPNPGQPYRGTHRRAFLPDNPDGREVLELLKKAFDAGLTFTVGRSVTTGKDGVVTWNDIHHKTRMDGGASQYGYPDDGYLSRVREELAAKGIS